MTASLRDHRRRHDLITAITGRLQHYKPLDTLQLLATPRVVVCTGARRTCNFSVGVWRLPSRPNE